VQLGVRRWKQTAGVVTGKMFAGGGPNAVADPRLNGTHFNNVFRIVPWNGTSTAIAGPGGPGGAAVADPRQGLDGNARHHAWRITEWEQHGGTVTSSRSPGSGALSVADPRPSQRADYKQTKYRVTGFDESSGAVIAASSTGNGAFSVADPRPAFLVEGRDHYQTAGNYGVVPWDDTAHAVAGAGQHDNGFNSVADPRLPNGSERLVCVIRARDNTWHRPFTTLELAALQSLADPEEFLALEGLSDSAWRERIGNAVPPAAAEAIAGVMGRTLLMAWSGRTGVLSREPVWVHPIAIALSVAQPEQI
jgi:hypothetical protein